MKFPPLAPDWKTAYADLVAALPAATQGVYGERLKAVVLFGSVARGTQHPDSDIDLLLVAAPLPTGSRARFLEFDAIEAVLAPLVRTARDKGVHVEFSPLIRTPEELEAGSFAFLDIPTEGCFLFDPEGLARDYFDRLAARLKAQGAERRFIDGSPYWVLKPSAKPGEPIPI